MLSLVLFLSNYLDEISPHSIVYSMLWIGMGGGGGGEGCGSLKWASVVSNNVGALIWSRAFLKEGANSYIHGFTKTR